MSQIHFGHKSHIGRSRKINQDSVAVLDAAQLGAAVDGLFVVADGMGGRAGGEVASQVTVQTVSKVVRECLEEDPGPVSSGRLSDYLSEAITAANTAVWNQSRANPELRGMGTTCVAALIKGSVAAVGNVGDSRAYLLRQGEMSQITSDHSLVHEYVLAGDLTPEEANSSRYKNVITRAIGITNEVAPDVDLVDLLEGDTILLCSDGLTNMLSDTEIARILAAATTPEKACGNLEDAANAKGGIDNITSIVVRYGQFEPYEIKIPEPVVKPTEEEPRSSSRRGRRLSRFWLITSSFLLLVSLTAGATYFINGGLPSVSIRWKPEPYKPPPPPVQPVEPIYVTAGYVSMEPFFGSPLTCDASGFIVARSTSGNLVRISPDGKTVDNFGIAVPASNVKEDIHMKADGIGNLFVSLRTKKVICKFNSKGVRNALIGQGTLASPEDLAIGPDGTVYVMDDGRLRKFVAVAAKDKDAAKAKVSQQHAP